MTAQRWPVAALAAAAVFCFAGEAAAQGRGGGVRGGGMPMMMGSGMGHIGPWTRMPSGPAMGLRTAGVGRFAASPGMSARMPLPGVTFSPQFAGRPFGTAQGLFNTPETAQFQASMRQFEAEAARLRAARQPSPAAMSWWGRSW